MKQDTKVWMPCTATQQGFGRVWGVSQVRGLTGIGQGLVVDVAASPEQNSLLNYSCEVINLAVFLSGISKI